MKTYCINLKRSPDRRAHCEALFADMIMDVEFIEGLDGLSFSPPNTILGNFLSHELIWLKIIASKSTEPVMILEDDCEFESNAMVAAHYLQNSPHIAYDVAMFGYWNPSGAPETTFLIDPKFRVIYGGDYRSTVGYMVNGHLSARKLLATLTK